MSHIRVLICRVDDPSSETMTELGAFDLPAPDGTAVQPETVLDEFGGHDPNDGECHPAAGAY